VYIQEEEEIQSLQKTISQMEAELDEEQNRLTEATTKLENSEKQLQKVSHAARPALCSKLASELGSEAIEKDHNLYPQFS